MRELLVDSCTRILSQQAKPGSVPTGGGSGCMSQATWSSLLSGGFVHMLSAAEEGPCLADAFAVMACVAAHAVPVPLAETLLASYVLQRSGGNAVGDDPVALLPVLEPHTLTLRRSQGGWLITGTARRVPWARHCRTAVIVADTPAGALAARVSMESTGIVPGLNLADEARDDVTFNETPLSGCCPSPLAAQHVQALAALMRGAQMTGTMSRIFALTLDYADMRRQFGRTLTQFQAVKHLIARMGAERAAATAAFDHAASKAQFDPGSISLPIAKIRIGEAATATAAIAHQIFGAIGYTRDHELQAHTRRLWSWRDEFGSEAQWSEQMGRQLCAAGAPALWPLISECGH